MRVSTVTVPADAPASVRRPVCDSCAEPVDTVKIISIGRHRFDVCPACLAELVRASRPERGRRRLNYRHLAVLEFLYPLPPVRVELAALKRAAGAYATNTIKSLLERQLIDVRHKSELEPGAAADLPGCVSFAITELGARVYREYRGRE